MRVSERAIELTGRIDRRNKLIVDEPLPVKGPAQVRIIILFGEEQHQDEEEWLRTAAQNSAFAFLKDPAEDIYTLRDGHALYEA